MEVENLVTVQTMIFLRALAVGAVLGVVYDLFRIFRMTVRCGTVHIFVQDCIYYFFCGLVTFSFMLSSSAGQIRFFILLGELLGAVLYLTTLGVLVMKVSSGIIRFVRWLLGWIYKLTLQPVFRLFSWFFGIFGRWFGAFFGALGKSQKKLTKSVNLCLKHKASMMYNLINSRFQKGQKKAHSPEEGHLQGRSAAAKRKGKGNKKKRCRKKKKREPV